MADDLNDGGPAPDAGGDAPASPAPAPSPDAGGEVDGAAADLALWDDGGDEGDPGEGSEGGEDAGAADALKAVPETPDGYAIPEIEGVEWSDEDVAVVDSLRPFLHESEISQKGLNGLAKWYKEQIGAVKQAEKQRDSGDQSTLRSAMIEALGDDGFKSELGKVKAHLAAMPRGLGKEIVNARLPNGKKLGFDPRFVHFFANLESAGPPDDTVREAELLKMMKEDPNQYVKTGQKELAELRAARAGGQPAKQAALSPQDARRKAELKKMMAEDPHSYHHKGGREEFAKILEREEAARRRLG